MFIRNEKRFNIYAPQEIFGRGYIYTAHARHPFGAENVSQTLSR